MRAIIKKFGLCLTLFITGCASSTVPLNASQVMQSSGLLPSIIELTTPQGDTRQVVGLAEFRGLYGSANPLFFYTPKGELVCQGTYSLSFGSFSGKVNVSCFEGQQNGNGIFVISGMRDGREFGTAHLNVPDGTMKIIYGLSDDDYKMRLGAL